MRPRSRSVRLPAALVVLAAPALAAAQPRPMEYARPSPAPERAGHGELIAFARDVVAARDGDRVLLAWIDHTRKHRVMVVAGVVTAVCYAAALGLFLVLPTGAVLTIGSPAFIGFVTLVLFGAIVESVRGLALSTVVTLLVPEPTRANANGQVGMVNGLGFAITSVFSGLAVGQLGMRWTLVIAVALTAVSLAHLLTISIPEDVITHSDDLPKKVDFAGAWRAIRAIDGLLALILFTTLNNLLGGVYMALLDPYGLTLVSVEVLSLIHISEPTRPY